MRKHLTFVLALCVSLLFTGRPAAAYTVQKGDTMNAISKTYGVSLTDLAALNPMVTNLNLIFVGENITTAPSTCVAATAQEKDVLARLIEAEAGGEPYVGKVAVGYVVLNRVDSQDFPDTITSVIYQTGQFEPVANGAINNPASADSIKAANEALCSDRTKGAGSLFFYNPKTATSHWLDSLPTTAVIGNHVFKK